ncbi:hypothetical protein CHISP_2058 [Chitinispirillum alkaliphilum]|nr:hypothetical protein CHISP_2058 [Chitinispirillum alkaliphilum]
MSILNVYFHKDFDGFVAAALFLRINEETQLVGADCINLNAVDYDIKNAWLKMSLPKPNIVIDFLYHPKAQWWFDHHVTTFLNDKHKENYANSEKQFWDINSPSCATLIKQHLKQQCSLTHKYNAIIDGFSDWIHWSDIIDNAKYDNPAQIVELKDPCLQINATLSENLSNSYIQYLVTAAKMYSPPEVVSLQPVKEKIETVFQLQEKFMSVFKSGYKLKPDNIVFFDYVKSEIPFQRYLTYYYEPDALYSIGLYRKNGKFSISVGKNPWIDVQSKNIGEICQKYGGGGRENVGSIAIKDYSKALEAVREICEHISN